MTRRFSKPTAPQLRLVFSLCFLISSWIIFFTSWGLQFGVPQDPKRIYMLGAKRSSNKKITNPPLTMPVRSGPQPRLSTLLLKTKGAKQQKQVMNKTAVRNLKAAKKKFDKHYARSSKPVTVDLAAGEKYARVCQDYAPTLLAGRCASSAYYWLRTAWYNWFYVLMFFPCTQ